MSSPYRIDFDIATIKHLGLQMYATLPPVIGELVANAWDANATEVRIAIPETPIDERSEIVIEDNGIGMILKPLSASKEIENLTTERIRCVCLFLLPPPTLPLALPAPRAESRGSGNAHANSPSTTSASRTSTNWSPPSNRAS